MNKQAHQSADLQPHVFIKSRAIGGASTVDSDHLTPGAQKRLASSRSDWPVRSTALRRRCDWPVRGWRHCRREHTGLDAEGWYHSRAPSIIGLIIINIIIAALESLPPVVLVPVSACVQKDESGLFWEEIHCLWAWEHI